METLIGIGIFLAVIMVIEGSYVGIRVLKNSEKSRVKNRLRSLSAGGMKSDDIDIVRRRMLSEVPWLNRLLMKITQIHKFDRLLEQANTRLPLGFFILMTLFVGSVGYVFGKFAGVNPVGLIVIIVSFGMLPFLYLYSKKQKRMARFQEQLPEALDLIARALKAGHAFSGGLKMVSDEFGDPIGTEFGKTLDEINFGVGVNDAMKNLSRRVDCQDLEFFVVSVIVQRETGGNLAEILEKIAYLIRERFKLYGHIRALAAEGKLSAIILIALPPLIVTYLVFINPKYISLLVEDSIGIGMTVSAVVLMIAGIFVMRRMIAIKV